MIEIVFLSPGASPDKPFGAILLVDWDNREAYPLGPLTYPLMRNKVIPSRNEEYPDYEKWCDENGLTLYSKEPSYDQLIDMLERNDIPPWRYRHILEAAKDHL